MEEGLAPGRSNRDNIFVKNGHDIVNAVWRSYYATKKWEMGSDALCRSSPSLIWLRRLKRQ